MFENSDPWAEIDALIERRARDAINIKIGYSRAFINRSRGQRRRWQRQREVARAS